MSYLFTPYKYQLKFKSVVCTSRGFLPRYKKAYYIKVSSKEKKNISGIGECSIFPGLSMDDMPNFEEKLKSYCQQLSQLEMLNDILKIKNIEKFPSVVFALETALLDLKNGGGKLIYHNKFSQAKQSIPINGLIWMADKKSMLEEIKNKINDGYKVIKMKIGGIDFEQECALLHFVRKNYSVKEITIRLDANGAFKPKEAKEKLSILSKYHIHSIEQPIAVRQWQEMAELCKNTPIPIALDEELIGIYEKEEKIRLLNIIKPQYIILKPTLLGGLNATSDWIQIAKEKNIGWWITSSLESNIGLNAIAQLATQYEESLPQGLGTGQIYENNFISPLSIKKGKLYINPAKKWGKLTMLEKF